AAIVDESGRDAGVRFVDLDKDGHDDLIVSNDKLAAVHLYQDERKSFGPAVEGIAEPIPSIVRDGMNYGAWFANDFMWLQNETTNKLPDGVDRRSFVQLLGKADPGPRSAERSHQSIRVRPGFTVELVAAEPLVMDPVAIDWGPDGKLWVVEMADYPLGLDDRGEPGGRVRYLEDTDGDGKYDRSTLFLDKIAFPTGVMAWRDGVLISAAPTVFFAKDSDGDGKADVRKELFRGFVEGNQQHRVNGFEWGLDNWVYLANGDSGGVVESIETGERLDIGGRDLRIQPDTGRMQAQAGRTQFGRHRDDVGNWFGCSNPVPVRHFVLDDHYLARNRYFAAPSSRRDIARVDNAQLFPISRVLSHWSGYRPPRPGERHLFTSACSTSVYRDNLFGPEFAANTFTCEPVHNAVHRRVLVPDGISFASQRPADEQQREFLASTDSWFRPATVTTGPDGAIWVVDMYRLVIEHPEWIDDQREKELFLRAGHDKGRIYRIYPVDREPRPIPQLGQLDTPTLVAALDSPNGRQRDQAQRLLLERNDTMSAAALRELAKHCENPLGRLQALCTLAGLADLHPEAELLPHALVVQCLRDNHPAVRRHAVRIAERWLRAADAKPVTDALLSAMRTIVQRGADEDAQVRLQLAYSLGECDRAEAVDLLAELSASAGEDPLFRAAV
ncbi:MAG: hypothetical protein KDA47_14675, partial [Planctomycetales bacterium]|nr:hypothetical protein [Planctomycetales bacterium]